MPSLPSGRLGQWSSVTKPRIGKKITGSDSDVVETPESMPLMTNDLENPLDNEANDKSSQG